MRRVIVAAVSLLISAGVAAAQTPGGSVQAGPFSLSAEALLWWFKDSPAPVPLVTDGIIGQPGTSVLLGGKDLDTGANPGFRLTAGYAANERWGLEGSFFYITPRSASNSVDSSGKLGSTDLMVPFFDVTRQRESGIALSLSPFYSGSAREELTNSLLGAELNGTWAVVPTGALRVNLLGGFRYLRLHEAYTFATSSQLIPPFPQLIWMTKDEFDTTNNFYGLQVGVRARFDWGRLFVSGAVKFALGAMVQSVDVNGSRMTNDFTNVGPTQTFSGGHFALPTNIGTHTRTAFAVVPELGLNVGYRITPWASVSLGYTLLTRTTWYGQETRSTGASTPPRPSRGAACCRRMRRRPRPRSSSRARTSGPRGSTWVSGSDSEKDLEHGLRLEIAPRPAERHHPSAAS